MPQSVNNRRLRRKRKIARTGTLWKVGELKQLGQAPDSVLARRSQRTIKDVVAMRESRRVALITPPRRWTAREIRLLGTMSDLETARRLRRSAGAVRNHRLLLKIPVFKSRALTRAWTRAEFRLLGTAIDREIARRLGCPVHVVRARRRPLQIPPVCIFR